MGLIPGSSVFRTRHYFARLVNILWPILVLVALKNLVAGRRLVEEGLFWFLSGGVVGRWCSASQSFLELGSKWHFVD